LKPLVVNAEVTMAMPDELRSRSWKVPKENWLVIETTHAFRAAARVWYSLRSSVSIELGAAAAIEGAAAAAGASTSTAAAVATSGAVDDASSEDAPAAGAAARRASAEGIREAAPEATPADMDGLGGVGAVAV
jgi:hypothetical protein